MRPEIIKESHRIRMAYLFLYHAQKEADVCNMLDQTMSYFEYSACLVSHYTDDEDVVVASLVYPTIKYNHVDIKDVITLFGTSVGYILCELTSISQTPSKSVSAVKKLNASTTESFLITVSEYISKMYFLDSISMDSCDSTTTVTDISYILNHMDKPLTPKQEELVQLLYFSIFNLEFRTSI